MLSIKSDKPYSCYIQAHKQLLLEFVREVVVAISGVVLAVFVLMSWMRDVAPHIRYIASAPDLVNYKN